MVAAQCGFEAVGEGDVAGEGGNDPEDVGRGWCLELQDRRERGGDQQEAGGGGTQGRERDRADRSPAQW